MHVANPGNRRLAKGLYPSSLRVACLYLSWVYPLDGGYVKARTSDSTSAAAYDGWYKSVYLPKAVTEAANQSEGVKVSSAKNSSKEVVS